MRIIPTAYWTIIGGIKNLSPVPETTAECLAKMPIQEVTLSKGITASQKEGQDLAEMAEKVRNLAEEVRVLKVDQASIKKATRKNTRALAAIRLRSLLDQSEAMAARCLELPEFASVYDTGDISRGWREWLCSLPKGQSARAYVTRMIQDKIRAGVPELKVLLEQESALDILLQGSRSKIRRGGNITAHGDYISEECYSEAIRDYFEDIEDSGDEEEGFTTLLRFVVAGRRFWGIEVS